MLELHEHKQKLCEAILGKERSLLQDLEVLSCAKSWSVRSGAWPMMAAASGTARRCGCRRDCCLLRQFDRTAVHAESVGGATVLGHTFGVL